MTNFIQTDQTRNICAESVSLREAICETNLQCQNTLFSPNINGRWTGRCVVPPSAVNLNQITNITKPTLGLCEYSGRN
jgi:hypothetical protein